MPACQGGRAPSIQHGGTQLPPSAWAAGAGVLSTLGIPIVTASPVLDLLTARAPSAAGVEDQEALGRGEEPAGEWGARHRRGKSSLKPQPPEVLKNLCCLGTRPGTPEDRVSRAQMSMGVPRATPMPLAQELKPRDMQELQPAVSLGALLVLIWSGPPPSGHWV
jgi:hypothetical protein